jgi:hypothetical protein
MSGGPPKFLLNSKHTMLCFQVSMWWAEDSMNPVAGWAYFISLIVIVSFNIVNLYVAVISAAYRR